MTNRGAVTSSLNCGGSYTIPAGYHNGSGKITANSLSSQTQATAGGSNIEKGKTAYVNGSKITGTMETMAGTTITPGSSDQTISCSGKKMTSNIIVKAAPNIPGVPSGGQVVFRDGVSPVLLGIHPYYAARRNPSDDSLKPSTKPIVFESGMPALVTNTNIGAAQPANGIILSGSVDMTKFSRMTIKGDRSSSVEPNRADTFRLDFHDARSDYKLIVGYFYGNYDETSVYGNGLFTISLPLDNIYVPPDAVNDLTNVFIVLYLRTNWTSDPNGGNHQWLLKSIELS